MMMSATALFAEELLKYYDYNDCAKLSGTFIEAFKHINYS